MPVGKVSSGGLSSIGRRGNRDGSDGTSQGSVWGKQEILRVDIQSNRAGLKTWNFIIPLHFPWLFINLYLIFNHCIHETFVFCTCLLLREISVFHAESQILLHQELASPPETPPEPSVFSMLIQIVSPRVAVRQLFLSVNEELTNKNG